MDISNLRPVLKKKMKSSGSTLLFVTAIAATAITLQYLSSVRAQAGGNLRFKNAALIRSISPPMAGFVVTKVADTNDGTCNSDCSLREAITLANSTAGADTITFNIDPGAGPHTIQLTSVLPNLSESVDLLNASGESITLSGEGVSDPYRIFTINSGVTVNISNLTMTNGATTGSGFPSSIGGGILNDGGTLTLTGCTVSNSSAASFGGGGIYNLSGTVNLTNSTVSGNHAINSGSGGGIFNNFSGTLNLTNSTVSGNDAASGGGGVHNDANVMTAIASTISGNTANFGGGIQNFGTTLTLTNSTISGNNANTDGGGIYNNHSSGTVTMTSVTVSNNRADNDNNASGTGGGIFIFNTSLQPLLRNTIVAGNFNENGASDPADDIAGTASATSSFNLIGTGGAGGLTNGVNNNQVGVASPGLLALTNNGGPTQTHALQPGSPAIDQGDDFALTTDQRGQPRPVDNPGVSNLAGGTGDGSDIGAFEASVSPNPVVTTTGGNLLYTENDPATVIDTGVTITDADSTNLVGATVSITTNFQSGQDVLSWTDNNAGDSIILSGSSTAQTIVLTGTGTVASYQAAVRVVKYQNTSDNPSTATRTVTFTANDGTNTGSGTRGVAVTAVNDAPVNTVPGSQSTSLNTPLVFSSGTGNQISVADPDAGAGNVRVQLSVTNGQLTLSGTSGLDFACAGCSGDGVADASMGFAGTITNVNAAMNGMSFTPTSGFSGSATLNMVTNDLGNTGSGGAASDSDMVNIQVAVTTNMSVQDAKVAEPSSGSVNMVFTVTLSAPAPAGGVSVDFQTQDQPSGVGKAVAGICGSGGDYTATSGTVSFAAGQQVKTINVPICADGASEPDETFLLLLFNELGATVVDGSATGTITAAGTAGTLLISELRTSGPGGAGDDFVEIYNNSDAPHTVNGTGGGYGLFKMGGTCADTPVLIGVVPDGSVIPARGHYLFVGSAYSLANYGGTGAAAGDQTMSSDIENDRNVAIFSTASLVSISTANRFDAVGFGSNTGGVCDVFREGTTLTALSGSVLEYSYFRDECGKKGNPAIFGTCPTGGFTKDSNVNNDDFIFADTAGMSTPAGRRLGAPGPQNSGSPRLNLLVPALLLDNAQGTAASPNRVRDLTPQLPNAVNGTLSIRRRFVNNTGAPVTRLRFRIVDISTLPLSGGIADLRALSSTDITVSGITDSGTCAATGTPATQPCTVTVFGTIVEEPPTQSLRGAFNGSMTTSTVSLAQPLAPGASINLQFLLGVQQTGSFKFFVNIEALP